MIRYFVEHPAVVALLTFAVALFGFVSYVSLPREASPDVKIPMVLVSTPYIGVSPSDVESLVTIPIENELAGIKDLKKLSSTSAEGVSIVTIEFTPDVVIEDALQRVRDRVDRAKAKLPDDVEETEVREISFSDVPILFVTIAGPADEQTLKSLAESLEDEVKRIPGVLETRVTGGREREVRVQVDPARLAVYGLGLGDVLGAIGEENVNIPGGDVDAGRSTFLLRVPGEFSSSDQIGGVAIKRVGDRPVFIRDVATVIDGFTEADSYARMNGSTAVSLAVTKRAGASIIDIADTVRVLADAHAERWPEGVAYRVLADQSKQIRTMVADLENNIITALILVVGVIVVSMGFRNSLFIAVSIPLAMLLSFIVIEALGLTLNMIVLFSLILALGMLVDNGIVIVENIYRHVQEGKDVKTACIDGTQEVAIAVTSSTLTTVAAFFPLVFWSGIMGEFMGYLPKTVIIVLTASLVVALFILPVLASKFLKATDKWDGYAVADNAFIRGYVRLLQTSIRRRYISAALGGASLVGTFVVFGAFNHGTEFFPATEPDRATVSVRTPDGTGLEATDSIIRRIEGALAQTENVEIFVAESGVAGGGDPFAGSQKSSNRGVVTLDFLPHPNDAADDQKSRVESTNTTIDHLRTLVKEVPGVEIEVAAQEMGPPVGPPIAVEVSGDGFHAVGEYAQTVKRRLATIEGITEVRDDYNVGRPELRIQVDRGAARRVGASTAAVANAVRTAVAGAKASALRDGKDEYDIIVEVDPAFRGNLQSVMDLRVPGRLDTSPNTFQVPLSAVARLEMAGGSGAIRHVDQELVVTINAKVLDGYNENEVRAAVVEMMSEMRKKGEVPAGMDLRLGGANDEQQESMEFLGRAFLIACILIAVVLVIQFNNFRLPAIIMMSVTLSLVGVMWGLLLTGTPFGVIMTGLGVISLAGVVVNNAIVLLDYIEQLRARGMGVEEALVKAGTTRLRPVLLTAITTVLGLVPMALGISVDFRNMKLLVGGSSAQFWGPMAIAVIFGLAVATVLTLVMVPTLYSISEDFRGFSFRRKPSPAVVATIAGVGAALALAVWPLTGRAATVSLDEALRAAEARAPQLALARERTAQAETLKGQAWAVLSPKISLNGSYTINQFEIAFDPLSFGDPAASIEQQAALLDGLASSFEALHPGDPVASAIVAGYRDGAAQTRAAIDSLPDSEPVIIQAKTVFAGNASLIQPLFSARSLPLLRGAYTTIDAARADELRAAQQFRAGVVRSYYALATAQQARTLAQRAAESARAHAALAEKQVQVGSLPPRASLQARLAVAQAERDAAATGQQVEEAGLVFSRLTGLPSDAELTLPEPIRAPAAEGAAVETALRSRADLRAAELRVDVARRYKQVKLSEWAPTLDGRFTWSWTENTGFLGRNDMWMVVLEANWLLWDGGLRIAQAREESSRVRQAELAARIAAEAAEDEVRGAWQRLAQAEVALAATEAEITLARENLRVAEQQVQTGAVTWLEVEDARLGVFRAELAQLTGRVSRDLAALDLKTAMGEI